MTADEDRWAVELGITGVAYFPLGSGFNWCPWRAGDTPERDWGTLALWGSGLDLWRRYWALPASVDGQAAGVLADWFEENRADLVASSADPRCGELVDYLTADLRARFRNPRFNMGEP